MHDHDDNDDYFTILVTGSRDWTDTRTIWDALIHHAQSHTHITLVHGAARGADTIADVIAMELRWNIHAIPADWARYGRSAGYRRNEQLIATGPDIVLAFPTPSSRGTWHTIHLAEHRAIPTYIYPSTPLTSSTSQSSLRPPGARKLASVRGPQW